MATKYKTARQLCINEDVYKALIWFKNQVKAGKLRHVKDWASRSDNAKYTKLPFNMDTWGQADTLPTKKGAKYCGSVHCIGGWLETKMNRALSPKEDRHLGGLFYPHAVSDWGRITPKSAVKVIEHYLKNGVIDWWNAAPELWKD